MHHSDLSGQPVNFRVLVIAFPMIFVAKLLTSRGGYILFVQAEVQYSDIQSRLELSEKEVEFWIIDAIRANLVDARMDQLQQRMIVRYIFVYDIGLSFCWIKVYTYNLTGGPFRLPLRVERRGLVAKAI